MKPLAGRKASFTDSQPLLADLGTPTECGKTYSGPWAVEVGSLEVEMAWKWEEIGTRNGKVIGMIWFTGLALFVLELGAGLDYVQARLASLMPGFVGFLPALAIAAWKVMETAFWNYAELERTFRIVPFATLPFLLVGVALWLRNKMMIQRQQRTKSEQR